MCLVVLSIRREQRRRERAHEYTKSRAVVRGIRGGQAAGDVFMADKLYGGVAVERLCMVY